MKAPEEINSPADLPAGLGWADDGLEFRVGTRIYTWVGICYRVTNRKREGSI